jgi:hypothetical protein
MRKIENYELNHVYGGLGPDEYPPVTVSEVVVVGNSRGPSIDWFGEIRFGLGVATGVHGGSGGSGGAYGIGIHGAAVVGFGDAEMIAELRTMNDDMVQIQIFKAIAGISRDRDTGVTTYGIGLASYSTDGTVSVGPVAVNPSGQWMVEVGVRGGIGGMYSVGDRPK